MHFVQWPFNHFTININHFKRSTAGKSSRFFCRRKSVALLTPTQYKTYMPLAQKRGRQGGPRAAQFLSQWKQLLLAWHTWNCPCSSDGLEETHKGRLRAMEGHKVSSKRLPGQAKKQKRIIFCWQGVIDLPSWGQSLIFQWCLLFDLIACDPPASCITAQKWLKKILQCTIINTKVNPSLCVSKAGPFWDTILLIDIHSSLRKGKNVTLH